MGNKFCGAEPAILTPGGNDLSPCFEFALRNIAFLYMLLIAIASVGPIKRTPVVPAAATFAHKRADFLLAAFAAIQSFVWLILDFALSDKRPDAFPAAPIFRLTTLLSLCAWSTSCVLILTTARRALRMPALHIAFWWAALVFDAKRIETGVLRVVRTDSIATAWDSVAALIEFATVLALLLWHRCCSDDPRGSVLSGSDGGDEAADFYDTQYNLENYDQAGDQSLFSIDASPFSTRTRSEVCCAPPQLSHTCCTFIVSTH
jgi:hypothetical protein